MWRFGVLAVFVVAAILAIAQPAMAMVANQTRSITVIAQVLPVKIVYVNDQMTINQIFSNTDQPAPLKVYKISNFSQAVPLTPDLDDQYQQIGLLFNLNQIGEVYNITWPKPLTKIITQLAPTALNYSFN